jgi:hypothetical protein
MPTGEHDIGHVSTIRLYLMTNVDKSKFWIIYLEQLMAYHWGVRLC